jgi:hypothetical protein
VNLLRHTPAATPLRVQNELGIYKTDQRSRNGRSVTKKRLGFHTTPKISQGHTQVRFNTIAVLVAEDALCPDKLLDGNP